MDKYPVIIPARAGSKGIKDKNIIDFCGRPLIAWSILQALHSNCVSNVYVSTDGKIIAEIAEKYGAKVIWRPDELATDTASSEDAILHAIKEIERLESFDHVIFLQATSPLRRKDEIDCAVEKYRITCADSLFSMSVLEDYCLWKKTEAGIESFTYDFKNRGRRQDRHPIYLENGSIYIFSKQMFFTNKNRLGGKIEMYEMPFEYSYEIDATKDINICEFYMQKICAGE